MDFLGFESFKFQQQQQTWISLLLLFPLAIGFLSLLKFSTSLLYYTYAYFLRPSKNLAAYGSWAVVTGSTDGIGKAFASLLAQQGLNVVLVGRSPQKLRAVSEEIRSGASGAKVKAVVIDFSGDLVGGVRRLREEIELLDVGVLVNNAGTTYPSAMYFHEVGEELWMDIIKVNLEGVTRVTQAVLPGMLERGRGAVICIGSGSAAAIPSHPLFAIYAATKAYVEKFCSSLHAEYRDLGIDVQCQIPMYVATKMVPFKSTSFFVPSPDGYVRSAIRWIGYGPRCTPHWTHCLQWWLASLVPDAALNSWRLRHGLSRRRPKEI